MLFINPWREVLFWIEQGTAYGSQGDGVGGGGCGDGGGGDRWRRWWLWPPGGGSDGGGGDDRGGVESDVDEIGVMVVIWRN